MKDDAYRRFADYDALYARPDESAPFPRSILALLQRHVRGDLLDVGCADGRKLLHIARHCPAVTSITGIDPSPRLVAEASARFAQRPGVRITHGTLEDATRLGLAPASFDTITLLEVIEHIDDQDAALRAVFALLRPGGVLVCSTPNRPVYGLHCRITGERRDPTHVSERSLPELRRLMARHSACVEYAGFWPFMFLFRRFPALCVVNRLPGTLRCSRTIYCVATRLPEARSQY